MRKLASIQKIDRLESIPNADKVEKATILGWVCVVRKGEFGQEDLCVYFEVDSLIPRTSWSEFLFKDDKDKFRLKSARIRKQLSQGLCVPLSILPPASYSIGDDVTEILGIEKYEVPVHPKMRGKIKGNFPSFLIKTDETRIQSVPKVLERYRGKRFYISEKADGSSFSAFFFNGEYGVCSRRMMYYEDDDNMFSELARKLGMKEKLSNFGMNIAVQGELLAPGVQKNKYKMDSLELFVFDVFDIDEQKYASLDDMEMTCSTLELNTVPILDRDFVLNHSMDEVLRLAEGFSTLNPQQQREGIVVRGIDEVEDEELGRLSFKILNNKFLLKEK